MENHTADDIIRSFPKSSRNLNKLVAERDLNIFFNRKVGQVILQSLKRMKGGKRRVKSILLKAF